MRLMLVLMMVSCILSQAADWHIYKVGLKENLPYLEEGRAEKLDLYYPADPQPGDLFPAVVIIHGGGWSSGTKNAIREINIGSNLARMGYVAISIDYVLCRKDLATWPRAFQDCKTAVQWLRVNADRLHMNPQKIGCIGGSAGGHLSALLAVGGKDMGLEPTSPYGAIDTSIQAGVNLYGIMDMAQWHATEKDGTPIADKFRRPTTFFGKTVEQAPELWRFASPMYQLDKNDPPILQIHGKADTTVDYWQAQNMKKALDALGIENEMFLPENVGHTFTLQNYYNSSFPQEIRPMVLRFFDKHLKGLEEAACRGHYAALQAWEAAHPDRARYWSYDSRNGELIKDLGDGQWLAKEGAKELIVTVNPWVKINKEIECPLDTLKDGLVIEGFGKRNGEKDITLDKMVILSKRSGQPVLGNISFLHSTLKKTENGWGVETSWKDAPVKQMKVWPLVFSEKFKLYRRGAGTMSDLKPGVKYQQLGGKLAGDVRTVDTIILR